MSKFGEKAFSFSEIPNFYVIPVSCSKEQCYINVGKNSVVKVHDKKPLHTWTLTHPNYFTSPVVYADETLYCIINNKVLIKWSVNEDNLKNAEKIKFQDPVFAVIPVVGKQPVVLFNSGKCVTVDETNMSHINPSDSAIFKENEELIWADASVADEDIKVFCLAHNEKKNIYNLYSFIISKEEKTVSHLCNYAIFSREASLRSWCLNHHDASFLTVWSDGRVCVHAAKNPEHYNLKHLKDINSSAVVAVTCIDSTHIIVAIGDIEKKECALHIWDTKFSVLKATKVLKASNLVDLQISSKNSNIFLYFNKEILAIPFQVEHSTVAAAAGKSLSKTCKMMEFSWDVNKGQLLEIPSNTESEPMDVSESKQDSIEMVAQRLLNQRSQYLMYIAESKLTELLKLALNCWKENKSQTSSKDSACVILNFVFSASFNDILLLNYLKRMNLDETLVVLELLLSFLNETIDIPSTVIQRPSDLQIMNWTCLIIQSHMEALLFSKDKKSKKLLKNLEKTLSDKMAEYEDYEGIQNYFVILQKKNILPEKSSVGKYCIDTLDI